MKYLISIVLFFVSTLSYAEVRWYESKVVGVSTRSNGWLYIRTELNPNPRKCRGDWPGARWKANESSNSSLAASIALSAKALDQKIKFSIDLEACGESGMPIMTWIQLQ